MSENNFNDIEQQTLHYRAASGIVSVLLKPNEDLVTNIQKQAREWGEQWKPEKSWQKYYVPSIMILDTFLSDPSDKIILTEICNNRVAFPTIHILLVKPESNFALRQPSLLNSGEIGRERETAKNKLRTGLLNIADALNNREIPDIRSYSLEKLVEYVQRIGQDRNLELKFYDEYPSGPMYFFNNVLVCGRFGISIDCIYLPWYTIVDDPVIEGYDLFDQNREEFLEIWKKSTIHLVLNKKETMTTDRQQHFDVAIVCALDDELDAVTKMGDTENKWGNYICEEDPIIYKEITISTNSNRNLSIIAACPRQMGLTAAASLTTKMLLHFQPKIIIMAGIAAGIKSKGQNFGDILIPDKVVDYTSGKFSSSETGEIIFQPDPNPKELNSTVVGVLKEIDSRYLDEIRRSYRGNRPKDNQERELVLNRHIGTIASGDQVIALSQKAQEIKDDWRKLIGIEMETYAVYYSAQETIASPPHFFCVKSVCDFADEKKSDDWQRYAAFTAAEYCYRLLKNDCLERLL